MPNSPDIVPPIVAFGWDDESVLVAPSVAEAVSHARLHGGTALVPRMSFFDAEGRPLRAVGSDVQIDTLELVGPREHLEHRLRSLLAANRSELERPDNGIEDQMRALLLDDTSTFDTILTAMAAHPVPNDIEHLDPVKHGRGGLHNLCHRLHICR